MDIALYALSICLAGFLAVKDIKTKKSFSMYSFCIGTITMFYLIAPLIIFIAGSKRFYSSLVTEIVNSTTADRLAILPLIWLAILCLTIPKYVRITKPNYQMHKSNYTIDKNAVYKVCRLWFWPLLLIGLLGMVVMILQIGVTGLIYYSGSSRGEGALEIAAGSSFAYAHKLAHFLPAALVPGIMMYECSKKIEFKIGLMVLFAFSLLLEIYIAGKANMLYFLLPILIYLFTKRKKKAKIKAWHAVVLVLLLLITVPNLDNLFYYISNGMSISVYRKDWTYLDQIMSSIRQFAYPFCNLLNRMDMVKTSGYRFGLDFSIVLINLLPAILLGGFQMQTAYHLTSDYFTSKFGTKWGVPNDFIFLCYRQLGVFGIVLFGSLFGVLIKVLDKIMVVVREALDSNGINYYHLLTSFCLNALIFMIIEPLSAINSAPMLLFSAIIVCHIYRYVRKV